MPINFSRFKANMCLLIASLLTACAPTAVDRSESGFNDPIERGNRQIHAFNRGVDRTIVRPILGDGGDGQGFRLIRQGLRNVAENLDAPRDILNGTLQGRIDTAVGQFFRFTINTTLGVGGLFDPAKEFGLAERDTDFGETLHVWGFGEGIYVELPFLGPSTMRDSIGDIVDALINPVRPFLTQPQNNALTVVNAAGEIADLSRASAALGEIYDTSADSYAQFRLIYLQNRRFSLARNAEGRRHGGVGTPTDDPYADDPNIGPYIGGIDALEDPYAETSAAPADGPSTGSLATDPYEDPYAP